MDRKTLIASMDILSQNFKKESNIAKDLRTMAYAVSGMTEEEFQNISVEAGKGLPPWLKKDDDGKVVKNPDYKKKAEIESEPKEVSEEEDEKKEASIDKWSSEASNAVQCALISDVLGEDVVAKKSAGGKEVKEDETSEEEKTAGKKKGPGIPDGTGPMKDSPECKMKAEESEEGPKEKSAEEKTGPGGHKPDGTGPHGRGKGPGEGKGDGSGMESVSEKKEAKDPEAVDTDILATMNVDGIELTAGLTTMDDIGDLSDEEQNRLGQLFQ